MFDKRNHNSPARIRTWVARSRALHDWPLHYGAEDDIKEKFKVIFKCICKALPRALFSEASLNSFLFLVKLFFFYKRKKDSLMKLFFQKEKFQCKGLNMSEIYPQSMTDGVSHQVPDSGKSLSMLKNHLDVLNRTSMPPICDGGFLTKSSCFNVNDKDNLGHQFPADSLPVQN